MRHPCMTWWPEKFFGDTAHVSPEAAAFYMVLLSHAWMRGGSLPNDDAALRNMTRLSRQKWAAIRREVMSFWTLGEDGRLHQKRLDAEWSRAGNRHPKPHIAVQLASHEVDEQMQKSNTGHKAQKASKNNVAQLSSTRARDPTPTPKEKLSALQAERVSPLAHTHAREAAAPLSVAAHATRLPPESCKDEAPPVSALTDEQRDAIVTERMAMLRQTIAAVAAKNLAEPAPASEAEHERHTALEKLAQWNPNLRLALSHTARKAAGLPEPPPPHIAAE